MDPVGGLSSDWPQFLEQFGAASLIFAAFMFLLRWVLKTQDKILDDAKEERKLSQDVMISYQKTLEQMNMQAGELHRQVTEAHAYQRSEHEKMIEGISSICTLSQQHGKCLEQITHNLDEQGKILLRINGDKHD